MKSSKDLLEKHGPAGSLVLILRRYALLGWVLFFLTAGYHALYVLVKTAQPIPVLTFDAQGRLLGQIDYVDPMQRADNELLADTKYFLIHYLSANSATIYDDAAIALTMMSEELRKKKLEQYKLTNQLKLIEKADVSSRVVFAREGDKKPTVIWRRDGKAAVRIGGQVRVGKDTENDFFVELTLRLVPRTLENAHGIEVIDIRDI